MKHISKNVFKQCIIFTSILITSTLYPMKDINHIITITSKMNKSDALLQLHYQQKEVDQQTPVGMLNVMSGPQHLKCFMLYPHKKKYGSRFTLSDFHSKEQILRFTALDGSSFTIHPKKDNVISVTGSRAARYIIKEKDNEQIEHIVTHASTEEIELACFTYPQ